MLQKNFKYNLLETVFIIYQGIFPSKNRNCRFDPTCSQYFRDALNKHGLFKGLYFSFLRLLSCNPMSTRPFYDPIK